MIGLALLSAWLTAPAFADEKPRTISVSGEGKAAAPPDMATIQTGVVSQAETASAALKQNNEAMERVIAELKGHGIADKDVQTSSFHVSPVYRHDEEGRRQPEIVAYQVQNQVQVRVRNLPRLGDVLDALVQAGSNQIGGVSFGVDDASGLLNQARSRAVRNARERAEVLAQAAGVKVGAVRRISESSSSVPPPRPLHARFAADAAASVPIATGEEEFHVTVQMVFELKDE